MTTRWYTKERRSRLQLRHQMADNPGERSPPQVKTEIMAQHMLKELLIKRSFQKYLIDSTVQQLMHDNAPADSTVSGQELIMRNLGFESPTSCRRAVIEENIDLLVRLLELITESFIRSSNLAFCDIGANRNLDAAALFSVRIQLERFLSSSHFQLLHFEQIVRRLCALLRCFATRISTPFQIANCAFFASSLCDLLYRFEEFCSIHERTFAWKFEHLRKAVDRFHGIVVLHLNKMITTRLKEEGAARKATKRSSPLKRTPQRPKSATTFRESEQALRSPGYLLPYNLSEKRRVLLRRSATMSSSPARQIRQRMRRTPHKSTAQNNAEGKAAHRLAREITKEVVDDLAARVNDVISRR